MLYIENALPKESAFFIGNYIHVDTITKNNKNYFNQQYQQLVSTTLRGNQLSAALKEPHVSVNWYVNLFLYVNYYQSSFFT